MAVSIPKVSELLICILIIDDIIKREKRAYFTRSADKSRRAADVVYPLYDFDRQKRRQNERSGKNYNREYSRADRRRLEEYERRGEYSRHIFYECVGDCFIVEEIYHQLQHHLPAEIERNIYQRQPEKHAEKHQRRSHLETFQRFYDHCARYDYQSRVKQILRQYAHKRASFQIYVGQPIFGIILRLL